MKIDSYRTYHLSIPLERKLITGIHTIPSIECVLVEVESEGHKGIGYTYCFNHHEAKAIQSLTEGLLEGLEESDISNIQEVWNDMWVRINFIGQAGPPVMAMSTIDTALWDIMGKKVGLPLYKLWGGSRDEVSVYASGGWFTYSNKELIDEAVKYKEQGYTHYKMKVGQPDWKKDIERVKLVRENLGPDFQILVDANQGWTIDQSLKFAKAVEEYDIYWLEEPIGFSDLEGTAALKRQSNIPIATGENLFARREFEPFVSQKAADILMPDLMRCGGPTEFLKVASLADAYNIPISSHTFAEVSSHLIAASPNGTLVEFMPVWFEKLFEEVPEVINGKVRLGNEPGCGYNFSKELIKHYEVTA